MSTLLAWWKGEDNTVDSVGGNSAAWVSSPPDVYATGYIGRCFAIAYGTSFVRANLLGYGFTNLSHYSIECYAKVVFVYSTGSSSILTYGWGLTLNKAAGGIFTVQLSTVGGIQVYNYTDIVNVWHNYEVEYNAGVHDLYIDGNLQTPVTRYGGLQTPPQYLSIGSGGNTSGWLDEVKVYDDSGTPAPSPEINIHGLTVIDKYILGFKKEITPYIPETLAASDYNQSAYDVKVVPDIESYIQKLCGGNFSKFPSIAGRRMCAVNFKIDIYATTFPAVPLYFTVLECCGWRKITHAAGTSIRPDSNTNNVPATIEVAAEQEGLTPKQIVYKITGAMGMIKMLVEVGKPVTFEFSFIGALDGIRTRTFVDRVIPEGFDDTPPTAFLNVSSTVFAGHPAFMDSFEVNFNEMVNLFSSIFAASGYGGARVIDRIITGKFKIGDLITDPIFIDAIDKDINDNVSSQVSLQYGTPTITLSSESIQPVNQDSTGEVETVFLNDDFELLIGSK